LNINNDLFSLISLRDILPRSSLDKLNFAWHTSDVVLLWLRGLERPNSHASGADQLIVSRWDESIVSLRDSHTAVGRVDGPSVSSGRVFRNTDHDFGVTLCFEITESIFKLVQIDLKIVGGEHHWSRCGPGVQVIDHLEKIVLHFE